MVSEKTSLNCSQIKSCILGLAIGDALGVPVEFFSRSELKQDPVRDMSEFGTHNQPEGTWSDDTSMTLALMDSLCSGLDYDDIMQKFCAWKDKAAYTATDEVFDMGITIHKALLQYKGGTPPLQCGRGEENDNGNGSLMRILPAALWCFDGYQAGKQEEAIEIIHNISALTHAHKRSQIGCGIYSFVLWKLLEKTGKEAVRAGLLEAQKFYTEKTVFQEEFCYYNRLLRADFADCKEAEIQSSGYVVSTLEAAVWCLLTTDTYADCVLKAVNLGSDTDTVAAVAGGLAGALYGEEGISAQWLQKIKKRTEIESLCGKFYDSVNSRICAEEDNIK